MTGSGSRAAVVQFGSESIGTVDGERPELCERLVEGGGDRNEVGIGFPGYGRYDGVRIGNCLVDLFMGSLRCPLAKKTHTPGCNNDRQCQGYQPYKITHFPEHLLADTESGGICTGPERPHSGPGNTGTSIPDGSSRPALDPDYSQRT